MRISDWSSDVCSSDLDKVAGWFVPAVLGIALLSFAIWGIWGPEPRLAHGLVAAVAVLIIACPCALGLATPLSIMVGIGRGAGLGVLIKDAEEIGRANVLTPGTKSPTVSRPPLATKKT